MSVEGWRRERNPTLPGVMTMKPLAITCGDPAGVGPEIIERWLHEHPAEAEGVVVLGPPLWLLRLPRGVGRVAVGREEYAAVPGRPDAEGALVAWAAMQRAAVGCAEGEYAAVVTGPVSKARLAAIGYPHPGQTEFFAAAWGGEPTMAFCGGRLQVVLATWHLPLREVPAALTPAVIERAVRAAAELAGRGGENPPEGGWRIAVCGLNPHAGEEGLLGEEERRDIDPLLTRLRAEFPGLTRALPGDTVFARALRGDFDVVVALYHDQGLAPLKTVDFDEAVNVTLGLPQVRTSPDHGTAFDLAGKGLARGTSFAQAVVVARQLVRRRVR
jgi:4-hydroxythreonine-4-phosphate dehydrogenase